MIERLKNISKRFILNQLPDFEHYRTVKRNVKIGKDVKLYFPIRLYDVSVGDFSYVGMYSQLKNVEIGKFCSIGPHCVFGWGIHPIEGVSTAPMFYSTRKQNGMTLSKTDKVVETKRITIGNDVFIGMNATILDGVSIGDGAVIGAGAVVSKNIPSYAVAVGNPIKVIRYRFSESVIKELLDIRWWELDEDKIDIVEKYFFDIHRFIEVAKQLKS